MLTQPGKAVFTAGQFTRCPALMKPPTLLFLGHSLHAYLNIYAF